MDRIGKYYSDKSLAIANGLLYAKQEKASVYLYRSLIGPDEFEYSLRFKSEIINLTSVSVLVKYKYYHNGKIEIEKVKKAVKRSQKLQNRLRGRLYPESVDHLNTPHNSTSGLIN